MSLRYRFRFYGLQSRGRPLDQINSPKQNYNFVKQGVPNGDRPSAGDVKPSSGLLAEKNYYVEEDNAFSHWTCIYGHIYDIPIGLGGPTEEFKKYIYVLYNIYMYMFHELLRGGRKKAVYFFAMKNSNGEGLHLNSSFSSFRIN